MPQRQTSPKRPKEKSDNIVILYAVIFCIVLVVYIKYIM
jgi:hypothetical protein